MPDSPHRLPELLQALLAERGWQVGASGADLTLAAKDRSQLVFVGNWQDPCPRRLLFDAKLESVDIVTWQMIRIHADTNKVVAFPSYTDLMRAVRVSRATIARALAVLRLTGWLPLCAALRDTDGRFAGHVYALNDEPLPLAEILAIDEGYVQFAEQAQAHRSAHVRTLAQDVFAGVRDAALAPTNSPLEPVRVRDQVVRRLDQMLQVLGDRVQNLNAADRVQNLNAVRSSSCIYKTTTTAPATEQTESLDATAQAADSPALIFPEPLSLTDGQRRVLALRLEPIPANLRQRILDEAAGRILAKRSTTDPVRCEFDYAARLCVRALEGQFTPTDAGERIRRIREERGKAEQRLKRAREHSEAQRLKELEKHHRRRGD